jgi:hypothetical protein
MKIITHPGQAHFDEFISCCYLLAQYPIISINRREPTQDELLDPTCFVIDVGRIFDPVANNYDHHQFPRDHQPMCAFSLVLGDNYRDWFDIFSWLKITEMMDSKGPSYVADKLDLTIEDLFAVSMNPIVGYVLNHFSSFRVLFSDDRLVSWMRDFGRSLIDKVQTIKETITFLDENARLIRYRDCLVVSAETFNNIVGLETWCKRQPKEITVTVIKDDRGPGLSLFRRNDAPCIDFKLGKDRKDCHFVHENGFVYKTTTTDLDILSIIEECYVETMD